MSFLFCRPDQSFMFGTVSGTVDSDYNANWLLDGLAGRPVRRASGGLALTATAPASRSVGIVAIVNHNIAGSVAISGGVTATIPAATKTEDDIYLNSFVRITPVSASSLVMTAAGTPAIVGELYAGQVHELERQLAVEPEFDLAEPFDWEGEFSSLAPYDPGLSDPRRLSGETIVSGTGLDEIHAWYRSTRRGTRPSLIVPVNVVNDAWLVTFRYRWRPHMMIDSNPARSLHKVSFEFLELPRVRW